MKRGQQQTLFHSLEATGVKYGLPRRLSCLLRTRILNNFGACVIGDEVMKKSGSDSSEMKMLQPGNVRQKSEECLSPNPEDSSVMTLVTTQDNALLVFC